MFGLWVIENWILIKHFSRELSMLDKTLYSGQAVPSSDLDPQPESEITLQIEPRL